MKKKKILYVLTGWPPYQIGGVMVYIGNLLRTIDHSLYGIYIFHNGELNILFPKMYLRKTNNIYSLVNSHYYLDSELSPIKDHRTEYYFRKVLGEVNPDIIHFQDLVGWPFSLIEIAKEETNAKIFNTFHNYYFICPRRDLIHSDGTLCTLCLEGYICPSCQKNKKLSATFTSVYATIFMRFLKEYLPSVIYNYFLQKSIYYGNPFISEVSINLNRKQIDKRSIYAKKVLNEYVDINLYVSYGMRKIFKNFGIKDNTKNKVMHLGTNFTSIKKYTNHFVRVDEIVFGFLGNPSRMKGLYLLIHAFNKLSDKYRNIKLEIYGCDKMIYQELNSEEVVNPKTIFHGNYSQEDLPNILQSFDVGVVPSIWPDSMPLVVFELFSAKIPIIGSNIGGIPDMIKNNKNGLLFKPKDENDLQRKMKYMIKNPSIILKYKKNIKPVLTMEDHIKELTNLYNNI